MAKQIEARDLRGERTERLIDAVPLSTPWTMFIEPTNACNARCKYCPTGDTELLKQIGRKNALMSWDVFTKLVGDLLAFEKPLKRTNTYKDGEPLLHPQFPAMMRYLKAAGVSDTIWTKTNGLPLNPVLNQELVTCGLDMIGVSVQHVNAEGFYSVSRVRVDYEKYRANVLDLFKRARDNNVTISVKIADVGLDESQTEKFYNDFGDRSHYISVEGLHGWGASDLGNWRLGTQNDFDGTPRTEKTACPFVLYMLTVSSNGEISVCNDDWAYWHDLGNVKRDALFDIWHGERLRAFRLMHLEGRRSENRACGTCDYLAALPDSIDEDLDEYIKHFRKERKKNERTR